jgi:hypothetical protein
VMSWAVACAALAVLGLGLLKSAEDSGHCSIPAVAMHFTHANEAAAILE